MTIGMVPSPDPRTQVPAAAPVKGPSKDDIVMDCDIKELYYGTFKAVRDTQIPIQKNAITAFIGPSGCGKSTVLRCLNRMNDLIRGFRFNGKVSYRGRDIYDPVIDPVAVRRYIGMVFQQPNPFATSIYNNVAFGLRINNFKGDRTARVEQALKRAAIWDEVRDKLNKSGLSLSGGQQQRLCIARAIAVNPTVLLMDEPCAALDPISTLKVEDLMHALKQRITIVIVTHNMQQATRVADYTAFMNMHAETRAGQLIEFGETDQIFNRPRDERTAAYISG